ncbi:MAG: hypothetical protein CMO55_19880 [Verrucomicrobiales bacterium]|nr:hypothetical protein [Verrucomicrobiales bacterium]
MKACSFLIRCSLWCFVSAISTAPIFAVDGVTVDLGSTVASFDADITPDGNFIVFVSSEQLDPVKDMDANQDIYLYDVQAKTVELVSLTNSGNKLTGFANQPSISNDGRYVCFRTNASDLGPTDSNGKLDVYVRDRELETTSLVSVSTGNVQADENCSDGVISGNGKFVAFRSVSALLVGMDMNSAEDVFVRDLDGGTTERVSISTGSVEAEFDCENPAISFDGRYVAFDSSSTNLVGGDSNMKFDVFLRDRDMNTTVLVSVDSDENQGNNDSADPSISDDGNFVAFTSSSSDLSEEQDDNVVSDIFVRDVAGGTTERVSVSSSGVQADGGSAQPDISANGRYVAFESASTTLVSGFADGTITDVYLHDTLSGRTRAISRTPAGGQSADMGAESTAAAASDIGFTAFESSATDLVANDTNGAGDIFLNRDISIEAALQKALLKARLIKKSKKVKKALKRAKRAKKKTKVKKLRKKFKKLKKQIAAL